MRGLSLVHGQRYHVCVYANATTATFEKFTQNLGIINTCTNGIVVDREPPEGGTVWVGGPTEEWIYQVRNIHITKSELTKQYNKIHILVLPFTFAHSRILQWENTLFLGITMNNKLIAISVTLTMLYMYLIG